MEHAFLCYLLSDVITFTVQYSKCTGQLEIAVDSVLMFSATVKPNAGALKTPDSYSTDSLSVKGQDIVLERKDIYKFLGTRGYDYGSSFQGLSKYNVSSKTAFLDFTY